MYVPVWVLVVAVAYFVIVRPIWRARIRRRLGLDLRAKWSRLSREQKGQIIFIRERVSEGHSRTEEFYLSATNEQLAEWFENTLTNSIDGAASGQMMGLLLLEHQIDFFFSRTVLANQFGRAA